MVCNGHYNEPVFPKIPGQHIFKGRQCHSHDYRKPEPFQGHKVVVIGAGPSGMDLALHISATAERVSECFISQSKQHLSLTLIIGNDNFGVKYFAISFMNHIA